MGESRCLGPSDCDKEQGLPGRNRAQVIINTQGTRPAKRPRMNHYRSLLLLLLCGFSAACLDIPEVFHVEPVEETPDVDAGAAGPDTPDANLPPDAGAPDSGTPDSGAHAPDAGDSGTAEPGTPDAGEAHDLLVTWGAPIETVHTNGTVSIAVSVTGGAPESVELLLDGSRLTTLVPPYGFQWNTSAHPERAYALVARASIAGRSFVSASRTVVVDRTPPHVVSRSPAPGAQHVSVRESIQAVFSEPIRGEAITPATVRLLSGGEAIPCRRFLGPDRVTLTLSAEDSVPVPATHTVQMTSGVLDLAGNALQQPSGAWSWSLPAFVPVGSALRVIQESPGALAPSLHLDAQGRPWVAWMESWSNGIAIHVNRWNGTAWAPVGGTPTLPGDMADVSSGVVLRWDVAGRPVVAWSNSQYINIDRLNGSGSWGRLSRLSASTANPRSATPDLETDSQGRLVVAWSGSNNGVTDVYVSRQVEGGGWEGLGALGAFPGGSTPAEVPDLEIDGSGAPVVAWLEQGDTVKTSIHVRRWNGTSWDSYGEGLSADDGRTPVRSVALRLDSNGRPVVTWVQSGKAYGSRWSGSAWSPFGAGLHAEQPVGTVFSSAVDVDSARNPVVASVATMTGDVSTHLFIERWDGERWVALGGGLGANPGRTSIDYKFSQQLDADGHPVLAWAESDGSANSIYVFAYNH